MALESKYKKYFDRLEGKQLLQIKGKRLVVEVLDKDEIKTAGGLFIAKPDSDHRSQTEANRPTLCLVLACGVGYYDEDDEEVPLENSVGSVIEVSAHSLKTYSEFPGLSDYTSNKLAIVDDDVCHMSWPSLEAYEQYKQVLNAL
jgi:co-chaperonin GroES (HSP10)